MRGRGHYACHAIMYLSIGGGVWASTNIEEVSGASTPKHAMSSWNNLATYCTTEAAFRVRVGVRGRAKDASF